MAKLVWQRTVVDSFGNRIPGAQVEVVDSVTQLPIDIWADRDANVPKINPFEADANGFARFYADPGLRVDIIATGSGGSITWRDVILPGDPGIGAPTVTTGDATNITGSTFDVPVTVVAFGATNTGALKIAVDYREVGALTWTRTEYVYPTDLGDETFSITGLDSDTEYEFRAIALDDLNPDTLVIGDVKTAQTLAVAIQTPVVTVTGEPNDVPETPTISGGAFTMLAGSDTHESTDWRVVRTSDSAIIWDNPGDTENLTSVDVPAGLLVENTEYRFEVRYNGAIAQSDLGTKTATTSASFVDPLLTISIDSSLTPDTADVMAISCLDFASGGEIDWGDGSSTVIDGDATYSHTYATTGMYDVVVWGSGAVRLGKKAADSVTQYTDSFHILGVDFGDAAFTSMEGMFRQVKTNFTLSGTADTSLVTNMSLMFFGASAFNQPLDFDTASVTNMSGMFQNASAFNSALSFDTASVTNMASMFSGATAFNQSLSFNTASATNMSFMFRDTSSFNQPLSFNTASVTTMGGMFFGASAFNQPLDFDTASVTTMGSMFRDATAFNSELNFNTASVTNMFSMFRDATVFNQDISDWNVAAVTLCTDFRLDSALTCPNTPALPTECTGC